MVARAIKTIGRGHVSSWQGLALSARVVSRDLWRETIGQVDSHRAIREGTFLEVQGTRESPATQRAKAEDETPGPGRGQMASQAMLKRPCLIKSLALISLAMGGPGGFYIGSGGSR